ncbi:hypothetical protein C8Q80DRAFT_1109645 [Daedaleopsis nitida]|nr:hypothetical protein C8Q80DRAFT_1109645 [Daedaleopsis nitida]
MTDFASQGRTRPNNVCDLQNCQTHHSVYTFLSRGSALEGTIIVQSFDSGKLTGGIAGSLRQKFRELELLDEITKMRYLGTISPKVSGITRNELVHSFRQWKGEKFVPKTMHSALKWTAVDPFPIEKLAQDVPWTLVKATKTQPTNTDEGSSGKKSEKSQVKKDLTAFVLAQGSQPLQIVSNTTKPQRAKRLKVSKPPAGKKLVGFPWDSVNHSCAYDSLLTVLLTLYTECRESWIQYMPGQSQSLTDLGEIV